MAFSMKTEPFRGIVFREKWASTHYFFERMGIFNQKILMQIDPDERSTTYFCTQRGEGVPAKGEKRWKKENGKIALAEAKKCAIITMEKSGV